MSKFNTFTQLKELMFAMEQDLGISELSEPEKCVFSCIVQATEAGGSISYERLLRSTYLRLTYRDQLCLELLSSYLPKTSLPNLVTVNT